MDPLGPINQSINFHNLRELASPGWIAVRIDAVCIVINNVLHLDLDPKEIEGAVDGPFVLMGTAPFLDTQKWGWPDVLRSTNVEEGTYRQTVVPLPEDQLQAAHVHNYKCLWIDADWYESVVTNQCRDLVDYKRIVLEGHDEPFYDLVCEATWKGFDVLKNNALSQFIATDVTTGNVRPYYRDGKRYDPDADFTDPRKILKYYNYIEHADDLPPHFADLMIDELSETEDDEPHTTLGPRGGSFGKVASPVKLTADEFAYAEFSAAGEEW
jgi:hypothetical protein